MFSQVFLNCFELLQLISVILTDINDEDFIMIIMNHVFSFYLTSCFVFPPSQKKLTFPKTFFMRKIITVNDENKF